MVLFAWRSSTGARTGPTAAMPWPLISKSEAAGGAGDVEATMAADAVSAMVKVACRISGSRNISHGISESSSPCISRNNSSISRGINESSSPRISSGTSNISNRSHNRSEFAVQQVWVFELSSLHSTCRALIGTMRSKSSMMTSELGKLSIKRRGGYRPNASSSYNTGNHSTFVAVSWWRYISPQNLVLKSTWRSRALNLSCVYMENHLAFLVCTVHML